MRTVGLIALALLFPVVAYGAADLININTADASLLDTLPGIGPSKAAAIIEYRTLNGPFLLIEDIQNVSGIGASTYANIAPLITVGAASESSDLSIAASSTPSVATSTPSETTLSSGGGEPEYLPIPTLRIIESVARTVSSGADTAFTVSVYDSKGNRRDDASVIWTFGDGMRSTGASVYHQYYSPGEYLAIVRAVTPDGGKAQKEIVVVVKDASIRIASVSARGIALANRDTRTLDLSLWRLSQNGQEFKIPEDTQILAGRTILFSPRVTGLPGAEIASLLYPSGEVAAGYPEAAAVQPPAPVVSYKKVQKVEPITSTRTDVQSYEETGLAPAATTELAAAGAALPDVSTAETRSGGLFRSPWTLSFLGLMTLAGGAFILL